MCAQSALHCLSTQPFETNLRAHPLPVCVAMALVCSQCGVCLPTPPAGQLNRRYLGRWVCSRECGHAAGDRSGCLRWNCGCTNYAKRRRLLRDHRINMRVMDDVIEDHGLGEELENRLVEATGNVNFFLGLDAELDESSDADDPEQQLRTTVDSLRSESADVQCLVEAVRGTLECRSVLLDLERARMELEDLRAARRE